MCTSLFYIVFFIPVESLSGNKLFQCPKSLLVIAISVSLSDQIDQRAIWYLRHATSQENLFSAFVTGQTQTQLYSNSIWPRALNLVYKRKKMLLLCCKNGVLMSYAVTTWLICALVLAYIKCGFPHDVTQIITHTFHTGSKSTQS